MIKAISDCQHGVLLKCLLFHDDVIKWKHFPRYWPFVRGIHRSPVNSPHKGQWCGALIFSLICARINGWVNNGEAGDLRRHRAHYDVTVMLRAGPEKKTSNWCYGPAPTTNLSIYHGRTQVFLKTPLFANFGRKNTPFSTEIADS